MELNVKLIFVISVSVIFQALLLGTKRAKALVGSKERSVFVRIKCPFTLIKEGMCSAGPSKRIRVACWGSKE